MFERKKKNLFFYLFNQRTLALVGLIILIAISGPLYRNIKQRNNINNEIKEMEDEVKRLEKKNSDLRKMIDYLGSNQFLEEQARLNFGLKKPGEEVVVIKDNSIIGNINSSSVPRDEDISDKMMDKVNNPRRWLGYFLDQ